MSHIGLFDPSAMTTNQSSWKHASTYISNTTTNSLTVPQLEPNIDEVHILTSVENYLWTYVSPVVILIGVFGNCLNIAVLKKMQFWRHTPLLLLAVLAVTDITVLLDGLLRYWIKYAFKLDIRTLSDASCKFNLYVIYFSMQYSSWILVCLIVDRFIKTNFPFLYMRLATIKKTCVIIIVIFTILSGINMHFFWTNGIKDEQCNDIKTEYLNFEKFVFVNLDFVVLSVLPFSIMLILNVFVYRALQQHHKFRSSSVVNSRNSRRTYTKRQFSQKLTRMLFFNSIYFLFSTFPISVYFIYDANNKFKDDLKNAKKHVAWSLLYLLQYSNYFINFLLYAACNKVFREKAKEIFGLKPKGYRYQNKRKNNQRSSSISQMTKSINDSVNTLVSDTYDEHSDHSEDIQTNANEYVDKNPNTQTAV